jgi:hypothetical protein
MIRNAKNLPSGESDRAMKVLKITAVPVSLAGLILAASLAATPDPVVAQTATSLTSSYACMERPSRGSGEQPTRIVAPRASVELMEGKGFTEFDCDRGGFPMNQRFAFQSRVCRMAAEHPEGMQQQFEKILGERPAVLCGMAEVALGQWDVREAQK